jgi:hypothetical protein
VNNTCVKTSHAGMMVRGFTVYRCRVLSIYMYVSVYVDICICVCIACIAQHTRYQCCIPSF